MSSSRGSATVGPAGAVSEPLRCEPVTPASRDALVHLLGELRVSVSGLVSPALHRALADAGAANDERVIALLAYVGDEPAGFVVGTRGASTFWRATLLRRPAVLLQVLAARLRSRLAQSAPGTSTEASTPQSDAALESGTFPDSSSARRRWEDPDGADGARIVFVGVRSAFRGRGIGEALYRAFFAAAAAQGATLVLARIARDNHASIRLHRAAGWSLYRDADGVLAVRTLDDA